MNRRHFLLAAASGGAVAGAGVLVPVAAAATDEELAYANFGAATELLLKDFYEQATGAELFDGLLAKTAKRGAFAAGEHVAALSQLLVDSGQTAPAPEDFEFTWPDGTFERTGDAVAVGAAVTGALQGAYLSGAATSPTTSFRVLYASLGASLGEQQAAFSLAQGRSAIGNSFPPALDLEAASRAVEAFLG
jgi:hypothetical protein